MDNANKTAVKQDSLFKKRFNWFVNSKLSVWGTKIAAQRHIAALRNAFIANTGFLIVGAVFLIIANFPIDQWTNANGTGVLDKNAWLAGLIILPKKLTFDMMSFWITALLIYYLARTYKLNPIYPMITGVGAFMILLPLNMGGIDANGNDMIKQWWTLQGIPFGGYTGTSGILIALIVGIIVAEVFRVLRDKNIRIPMPAAVPPAVSATFSAMIPIAIVFIVALILRGLFGITTYHYFPTIIEQFLGKPISNNFVDTLGGIVLIQFLGSFGWCFGINSSAINGIVRPFWAQMLSDNQNAWQHYLNSGVYQWDSFHIGIEDFYNYSIIGGAGATLPIVLCFAIFARSEKLKTIARLSLIPGIFNINEPWMFGLPVVLNPFMWLPLIFAPIIISIVAYLGCYLHLVWMPIGFNNPWTLPIGVLGYFTNLHYSGAVIQVINFFIAGLIWFPFIKFYDLQEFKSEYNIDTNNILKTFKIAKEQGVLPPLLQFATPNKESDLALKRVNLLKIAIKKVEEGQEKFGYDLKIKKIKGKLRDIKLSDFDGTKFPRKEPIYNAKIELCNKKIEEMKQQRLLELNSDLSEKTAMLEFYNGKKDVVTQYIDLKANNRKNIMVLRHKLKKTKLSEKIAQVKGVMRSNRRAICEFWLKVLEEGRYPFAENAHVITFEEKNKNLAQTDPEGNRNKIISNEDKIKYFKSKIDDLKIKKIKVWKTKLSRIKS